ncbi:hypothetical protein FACS189431_8120 [Alphaproteobacteria bacterium]|nr:hypothetical protein FACS189431_8120 [Alphaproteobacteria bacterium]
MEKVSNMSEIDLSKIKVELLLPDGLGFGDGSISYQKAIDSGELLPEVNAYAREILTSGECLVPIEEDDDGCIDGRQANEISFPDPAGGGVIKKPIPSSDQVHNRAKVPGGGGPVRLLMWFATRKPLGDNILADVMRASIKAAEKGQPCGMHNGEHLKENTCDCGAIDHLRTIMEITTNKYTQEICDGVQALSNLVGTPVSKGTFDHAMSGWQEILGDQEYFKDCDGKKIYGAIADGIIEAQHELGGRKPKPLATSKYLCGDHHERYIVLDCKPGTITSQDVFRRKLRERFPNIPVDQLPDFFSVTLPRIEEIAVAMSHNDREMENTAFASGLAQTLGTAAQLTDGSLPVYTVTAA